MTLDPTSRESNIRDSLKKFFVDNIQTTEKIPMLFDKTISVPKLTGTPSPVDRWVNINFGNLDIDTMSSHNIEVFVCQRKDPDGFKATQLRDTVVGYLTDTSTTDGMKRIPFYQSFPSPTAWVLLGAMIVQGINESQWLDADDETKFKVITVTLRFASK